MDIRISSDPADIDFDAVHRFLSEDSYWCPGIPAEVLRRAMAHSLNFSALDADGRFLGYARVVSDRATFAYLCDVFVLAEARGHGVGKALCEGVLAHPELQHLRRFLLATADAHALYAQYGFTALDRPERFMQRYDPRAYLHARD